MTELVQEKRPNSPVGCPTNTTWRVTDRFQVFGRWYVAVAGSQPPSQARHINVPLMACQQRLGSWLRNWTTRAGPTVYLQGLPVLLCLEEAVDVGALARPERGLRGLEHRDPVPVVEGVQRAVVAAEDLVGKGCGCDPSGTTKQEPRV